MIFMLNININKKLFMHSKPNGFAQNFLCPVVSKECTAMDSSESNVPNLINVASNKKKIKL